MKITGINNHQMEYLKKLIEVSTARPTQLKPMVDLLEKFLEQSKRNRFVMNSTEVKIMADMMAAGMAAIALFTDGTPGEAHCAQPVDPAAMTDLELGTFIGGISDGLWERARANKGSPHALRQQSAWHHTRMAAIALTGDDPSNQPMLDEGDEQGKNVTDT